jgi:hypothetical protein
MNDDATRDGLGNLEDLLPPRVTEYRAGTLWGALGAVARDEPATVPITLPSATTSAS